MTKESTDQRVIAALDSWLRWLPSWSPATHRGRMKLCRRCTGSPIALAAGLTTDVPHQVTHALVSRMHRVIERVVDVYTEEYLPVLQAELEGEQLWKAGEYDPNAGLEAEHEGLDQDPVVEEGEQPFLFTLAELAESSKPDPSLPRPPLSAVEKEQLKTEIELADRCAAETGNEICFTLLTQQSRITTAVQKFVVPQINSLLEELSRNLEPPR